MPVHSRHTNISRRVKKAVLAAVEARGYSLTKTIPHDLEADFVALYHECREYTMTSVERMYAVHQATRYVVANDVPGAIVECGVWRGGSVMMSAMTLGQQGISDREFHLFDTFEGQPPPSDRDETFRGSRAMNRWKQATTRGVLDPAALPSAMRAYASLDEVRANVSRTGYPQDRFVFVKGMVEDTLPARAPAQIVILRLDTDWYESTYHELQHLWPLVSDRGVAIFDDYGFWKGARTAVDQYFREQDDAILLHRIDSSGRMVIKRDSTDGPSDLSLERRLEAGQVDQTK